MDYAELPTLIDTPTLAARLGISVRHVRRLVAERRIPHHKIGGLTRFDPTEITDWLAAPHRPARPGSAAAPPAREP